MFYYNPSKVQNSTAVSLTEAKEQLNILAGETDNDTYITKLVDRALSIAEFYIEKDINEKTCTVIIEAKSTVYLQDGEIKSITSIKDEDTNDVTYEVEYYPDWAKVTLDTVPDGNITVIYKTGWTSATLPELIRASVLLKIGELYDIDRNNSTVNSVKITNQFEYLLNAFKKQSLKDTSVNISYISQ